jgi:hypothetical protein
MRIKVNNRMVEIVEMFMKKQQKLKEENLKKMFFKILIYFLIRN